MSIGQVNLSHCLVSRDGEPLTWPEAVQGPESFRVDRTWASEGRSCFVVFARVAHSPTLLEDVDVQYDEPNLVVVKAAGVRAWRGSSIEVKVDKVSSVDEADLHDRPSAMNAFQTSLGAPTEGAEG